MLDGNQSGPYTATEIIEARDYRRIRDSATVWAEGMDAWKPMSEVIQPPKVPLHPDVEKLFPSDLFIGERKNEWISRYREAPDHFERLKGEITSQEPVLGFLLTSSLSPDTTQYYVLYAVTAKKFWVIWSRNANMEKQMGINEMFRGFLGSKEESFDWGNAQVQIAYEKRSGFFSIDGFHIKVYGNSRFLTFTGAVEDERDVFFDILARLGFKEHFREENAKSQEAKPSGCLVLIAPAALGALIYGITQII